ncbi:MAG: hypothetical protein HWN66_07275 [Candidatus Helarchaeota archaeon]|nr:hypothetical protein [Candidatus Helarchaeota archaeon]
MTNEEVKCIYCGKVAGPETIGKSISFYVNWIEYLPGKWMCRECKEGKHDKNLVRYKIQFLSKDSKLY